MTNQPHLALIRDYAPRAGWERHISFDTFTGEPEIISTAMDPRAPLTQEAGQVGCGISFLQGLMPEIASQHVGRSFADCFSLFALAGFFISDPSMERFFSEFRGDVA